MWGHGHSRSHTEPWHLSRGNRNKKSPDFCILLFFDHLLVYLPLVKLSRKPEVKGAQVSQPPRAYVQQGKEVQRMDEGVKSASASPGAAKKLKAERPKLLFGEW